MSQVLPPPEQDAVVAGLLRRLRIEPPGGHPFRALQSMCDWWADTDPANFVQRMADLLDLDAPLLRQ